MEACIEKDEALKAQMAAFKDGKWAGMELASHIGFTNWNDEDWRYPVRHVIRLPKKPRLVVTRADKTQHYTNQYFPITLVIDDFVVSSSKRLKFKLLTVVRKRKMEDTGRRKKSRIGWNCT